MDMSLYPHAVAMSADEFMSWSDAMINNLLSSGTKRTIDELTGVIKKVKLMKKGTQLPCSQDFQFATNSTNPIIDLIYNATYAVTKGYSYAAAMTWMYTVIVAILLLITFLIIKERKEKKSKDIWRRDVESNRRGMQSKKVQKLLERGKAA